MAQYLNVKCYRFVYKQTKVQHTGNEQYVTYEVMMSGGARFKIEFCFWQKTGTLKTKDLLLNFNANQFSFSSNSCHCNLTKLDRCCQTQLHDLFNLIP